MATYSRKRSCLADNDSISLSGNTHSITCPSIATNDASAAIARAQSALERFFRPARSESSTENNAPRTKKPRLCQTIIDLGGSTQKTCAKCSMQYMPTVAQDVKSHLKYCAQFDRSTNGPEITRREVEGARRVKTCRAKLNKGFGKTSGEEFIVEVSRRSALTSQNLAIRVLNVAESELGALKIGKDKLWSTTVNEQVKGTEGGRHDSFKAYLYISHGHCVGLCLAQRIEKAMKIVESALPSDALPRKEAEIGIGNSNNYTGSSFVCADMASTDAVVMGVSRIWVARHARGNGIAEDLLNAAQATFLLGKALTKDEIAFSQPTQSGLRLARKWHRKNSGWCVYDERHIEIQHDDK